ncbi:hypothetical protein GOEFS_018_00750 [Gordonia effusa NBRC 100432]|uniref:DUF305 domain-containing protein n=1 Tax=Gordonia effusa NBRC 100432 TaxID=1077974 RepID=H0QW42_9ACTN|nr:DUF305 domain-containing protein [Gordonia effusa]GAB17043.1 hypothetical protein GOEFS_018_00750 [Gordonia effusa NBRC 100432]
MSFKRNSIRAALIIGGAAILVAGCGTDTDSTHTDHSSAPMSVTSTSLPASSVAQHNSADVMFNQMMIPHHAQAVTMAALVATRTSNEKVRRLASAIKAAQQPEIDQMTARLRAWGQPTELAEHGGHRMTGMISEDEMAQLTSARDTAFDRLWLQMMVRHHEGAVTMANAVLTDGTDPDTRKLASAIKVAQQAEIKQMTALLGQ